MRPLLVIAFLVSFLLTHVATAGTDIRDEPGGKRLLFVDGNDIRTAPGGPRKLFIDGDAIHDEPGGKRLLFVDGDSVRPEPGGARLLFVDGNDIRNAPGGQRKLFVDGKDIRPEPGGERLLFIDGDALTRQQLVAVLFALKPELFAAPEAETPVATTGLDGTWTIDSAIDLDGEMAGGKLTLKKQGDVYVASVAYKGQEPVAGIAVQKGSELWLALGTPKVPGIGIYDIEGGTFTGKWYANLSGDEISDGTEIWKGDGKLAGTVELVEGKHGDASYKGSIDLKEIDDTSGFGASLVHVLWKIGDAQFIGVAFRAENGPLVVSFGVEQQKLAIVRLMPDGDTMSGAIVTEKGKQGIFNVVK